MADGAAVSILAHQRDLLNKLKAGGEIPKFTGGSTANKTWTEGLNRRTGDLTDAQKIQLLRAKVHGTAGRMLDDYNSAVNDGTKIALLKRA